MPVQRLLRILMLGLGLAWLVTACVRLNEPDQFICQTNADCESGEKCYTAGSHCVAKDFCQYANDCGSRERCAGEHCVAAECTFATEATDCKGFPCMDGLCGKFCGVYGCADGFHCANSACVPGRLLGNGQKCQTNPDCSSFVCCAKPSGSVCTSSCSTPPTDACSTALDCASGICCARATGAHTCSAVPCTSIPECTTNTDCPSNEVCQDQKCVAPPPLKAAGVACTTNAECQSEECISGECRGTAMSGETCTGDFDCTSGRICCQGLNLSNLKSCSQLNFGCPGSIGYACEVNSDCLSGNCNSSTFCTKACQTNLDCGTSPWGVPNACETNGLGDKICFPGCSTTEQCSNLSSSLQCVGALDSTAEICASG